MLSRRAGRSPSGFSARCVFLVEYRICPLALVPYVPTGAALGFVNTYNLTALTASPSLVLFFYELLNAKFVNVGKILDHAHTVLGPIAGV